MSSDEMELVRIGMTVTSALLASTAFLLGIYLSEYNRGTSRAKLTPYLVVIFFLTGSSITIGVFNVLVSSSEHVLRVFALLSLLPNFVILALLALRPP